MTTSTERVRAMRARKAGRVEVLLEQCDLNAIEAIRAKLDALGHHSEIPVSMILLRGLYAYMRSIPLPS